MILVKVTWLLKTRMYWYLISRSWLFSLLGDRNKTTKHLSTPVSSGVYYIQGQKHLYSVVQPLSHFLNYTDPFTVDWFLQKKQKKTTTE